MKKNILLFEILIFSIVLCNTAHAQHSDVLLQADSLIQKHEYENALNLVNRTIDQKPTRFVLSNAYYQLGRIYLGLENFEKAIYYNQKSLEIRNDLLYELTADNYMLFGLIEMQRNNDDKALGYFLKATGLPFESVEFSGLLYAYIALANYRKGNMEEVLKYYKIAMESWMTAYEETSHSGHRHYIVRKNRLFYDNFFVGFL